MPDKFKTVEMRPIADQGVLVEFGDVIDDTIHNRVLDFDDKVQQAGIPGFIESVPAYASVYVEYDPLEIDYASMCKALKSLTGDGSVKRHKRQYWQIPTCYEGRFAPDLEELAERLGLSQQDVIQHHISGQYKVYMYGFAPGYAYLGGVPEAIQMPRKQVPKMDIPTGAVMVAGPQCLITTLKMPSGWWVIGRTAKTPLQKGEKRPFMFNIGDRVEFVKISEAEFIQHGQNMEAGI